ncbi:hypothetical protein BVC80_9033g5 [Macleaya cordata]|uniref:Uncharacterized protein n=1 Tax=Macleaya cordata TaxID=56857 RepID=A0A200QYH6_MACCD|nr:hypothetical protein BVC80_9033g5 [Macleaya cordata]
MEVFKSVVWSEYKILCLPVTTKFYATSEEKIRKMIDLNKLFGEENYSVEFSYSSVEIKGPDEEGSGCDYGFTFI